MLPTARTRKENGKDGVICVVSMLSTCVVVLKMSKMDHFFKFLSCLQRTLISFRGSSSGVSERSYYIVSQKMVLLCA